MATIIFKWIRHFLKWTLLVGLLLTLLQYSSYPSGLAWNAVALLVDSYQFDYVGWEINALAVKADQTLYGLHPFMTEAARVQFVRDYMEELRQAQTLEGQINQIFSDPNVSDPQTASANLRFQRDSLRARLSQNQTTAEAILEGQVAAVLIEQGFGVAGQLLPPISARFTQVPSLLVVSPRDQIRFDISINLDPIPVDEIDRLERRIDAAQNVSSLVVPLGGIALYPAMVLETASIPAALDTIAHEWLHHYLFFFPLGLAYFAGEGFAGETRIINETTASIFGHEVSQLVLAKYYPDLLPQPVAARPTPPEQNPTSQPSFDFSAELDKTRRRVDELLGAGKIAEAESYMEARREVFAAHGYVIRKLNQAFFAFYGGYQAGGTAGAGGADPIGTSVQDIRTASPSLYVWVVTMRSITTRDELLAEAAQSS